MTREELEMRVLVRESDVIDRTDGSELAKAFNHLWEKYVEQEPCDDAISRQAVLKVVEREQNKGDALSEIEKLPPVNPQEPRTGRWIREIGYDICSECGSYNVVEGEQND